MAISSVFLYDSMQYRQLIHFIFLNIAKINIGMV